MKNLNFKPKVLSKEYVEEHGVLNCMAIKDLISGGYNYGLYESF
jgi:hypothetical protein